MKQISWDEISDVWRNHLWPGRDDIIGLSCMTHDGKINTTIRKLFEPTHHGLFHEDKLVGVISGHQTSSEHYRCRGIYVFEKFRKNGFSQMLFERVSQDAIERGCRLLWSFPRLSAIESYKRFGFVEYGKVDDSGFSGPNIKVFKRLEKRT